MSFGIKLQNLRKVENLSQGELALKIGVSQKTISSWETDRTSPSISDIDKLCSLFNVGMNYFSEIETRVTKPIFGFEEDDDITTLENGQLSINIDKLETQNAPIKLSTLIQYVKNLSKDDRTVLKQFLEIMDK